MASMRVLVPPRQRPKFAGPYKYYISYFVPVFLISLYRYTNLMQLPVIKKFKFLMNVFYRKTAVAFLQVMGFLFLAFLQFPHQVTRLKLSRPYQWQYTYAPRAGLVWDMYVKIVWLIIGKVLKTAFSSKAQVNSFYQYTFRTLRLPEIHYYDLQVYDQGLIGFCTLQFQLRKKTRTVWEEMNLLRMHNLPLFRQK
jgi:hypothetical protein